MTVRSGGRKDASGRTGGFSRRGFLEAALFAFAALVLALWWHTITPSHDRDWAPDVARLLHATRDGDIVTLENVRNFEWRTRQDFDARWETRQYDLSELESADLIVSYWMGPTIAHTLVSFGFTDGRHLVFSVEVRRTRGQSFSAIGGFFLSSGAEFIVVVCGAIMTMPGLPRVPAADSIRLNDKGEIEGLF